MKKQRKHYTPEEKVAIPRRHLLEKEPISRQADLRAHPLCDPMAQVFTDLRFRALKVETPEARSLNVPIEFRLWANSDQAVLPSASAASSN